MVAAANSIINMADMPLKIKNSKFRHVYGQPTRKDGCFENIRITKNAHDSNFCSINPKFLAVVLESVGGGAFLVLPIKQIGRVDINSPKVCGHSAPITDIKWNPFDDHVIASCSDDMTIKIWEIPELGLHSNMTNCVVELIGHGRRVTYIEWHPTAENILLSCAFDYRCIVWDVAHAQPLSVVSCHNTTIYSISWNSNGSLFATTCKDKKIRVIDPRTGAVIQVGAGHSSLKTSKVIYLNNNKLFTTGFSKSGDREFALWDALDLSSPIHLESVDYSSGVLLPFYDSDIDVIYLAGKGDGNIRYYEVQDKSISFLNQYPSSDPQRGLGQMPKRGLDVSKCEIARFYKLHTNKQLIEPLPMIVPRRSDEFAEHIYPPTLAATPAMTADEWISGLDREPVRVSVKPKRRRAKDDIMAILELADRGSNSEPSRVGSLRAYAKTQQRTQVVKPVQKSYEVKPPPKNAPASLQNIYKLCTDTSKSNDSRLSSMQHESSPSDSNVLPSQMRQHRGQRQELLWNESHTRQAQPREFQASPIQHQPHRDSPHQQPKSAHVRPHTQVTHSHEQVPQYSHPPSVEDTDNPGQTSEPSLYTQLQQISTQPEPISSHHVQCPQPQSSLAESAHRESSLDAESNVFPHKSSYLTPDSHHMRSKSCPAPGEPGEPVHFEVPGQLAPRSPQPTMLAIPTKVTSEDSGQRVEGAEDYGRFTQTENIEVPVPYRYTSSVISSRHDPSSPSKNLSEVERKKKLKHMKHKIKRSASASKVEAAKKSSHQPADTGGARSPPPRLEEHKPTVELTEEQRKELISKKVAELKRIRDLARAYAEGNLSVRQPILDARDPPKKERRQPVTEIIEPMSRDVPMATVQPEMQAPKRSGKKSKKQTEKRFVVPAFVEEGRTNQATNQDSKQSRDERDDLRSTNLSRYDNASPIDFEQLPKFPVEGVTEKMADRRPALSKVSAPIAPQMKPKSPVSSAQPTSALSNDELHKAYFKQCDEIKLLRQQNKAKDKRIESLEKELSQLKNMIIPM
ncbi:uncharacterized protein [Watersipora subatra]|uniref:uncharacterized protein isoform X4 n=1 Tax=Watersipora subatra TaxID=2589382 RepID=UPI00355C10A1